MQSVIDLRQKVMKALLRAVARRALDWGIKTPELIATLKGSYLQLAEEELLRAGEKVTVSRLAVMTGIHRKFIPDLLSLATPDQTTPTASLLTRIIGAWQTSRRYKKAGEPRPLGCVGPQSEFARLVLSVSSDLNPYTVLHELERIGLVERAGELVALRGTFLRTRADVTQTLNILEGDVERLTSAVSHNISEAETPQLHLTTEYDAIPAEALPKLKRWLLVEGSKFHARARAMISKFDKDLNPHLADKPGRFRVGLSAFSLVEEQKGGSSHERRQKS